MALNSLGVLDPLAVVTPFPVDREQELWDALEFEPTCYSSGNLAFGPLYYATADGYTLEIGWSRAARYPLLAKLYRGIGEASYFSGSVEQDAHHWATWEANRWRLGEEVPPGCIGALAPDPPYDLAEAARRIHRVRLANAPSWRDGATDEEILAEFGISNRPVSRLQANPVRRLAGPLDPAPISRAFQTLK